MDQSVAGAVQSFKTVHSDFTRFVGLGAWGRRSSVVGCFWDLGLMLLCLHTFEVLDTIAPRVEPLMSMCVRTWVRTYVCMCVCIYVGLGMYVCMHVCMYVCM